MKKVITAVQVISVITVIGFLGTYENGGTFIELIKNSAVSCLILITGQALKCFSGKGEKFRIRNSDIYIALKKAGEEKEVLKMRRI